MYITPEKKSKQLIEKFGEKSLLVADELLEATKSYDWRTNKYSSYWLEVKISLEKTLKEYETNVS